MGLLPAELWAEFVFFCLFFLSVCPSRYDARHRKPRRCVYALNLGGTGISPSDSFSFCSRFRSRYRSNFRSSFRFCFRSRFHSPDKNPPGPGHPTSGDIFYCSGSRQLNHSSYLSKVAYRPLCCGETVEPLWCHCFVTSSNVSSVLWLFQCWLQTYSFIHSFLACTTMPEL